MNAEPVFKRIARIDPVIKADQLAFAAFERQDPAKMVEFLTDFGLVRLDNTPGDSIFFRARGTSAYCVEIVPSDRDYFIGSGFFATSRDDLEKLSAASGQPIEPTGKPGGGERVRLTDPDGNEVDVIFGMDVPAPLPARTELIAANTPDVKNRINMGVRTEVVPTPVHRLGHIVLFATDFAASVDWYQKWIGILPTDVLTTADGVPCGGFFRVNRGEKPADHHNLAIFAAEQKGVHHVSMETLDIDEIGQGNQYLQAKGWDHFWGMGRHILGSQFFDYWLDPTGLEWEHYADGDVMTEDFDEGYFLVGRKDLWAWGDDLPDESKIPEEVMAQAPAHLKDFYQEWSKPARPWLK